MAIDWKAISGDTRAAWDVLSVATDWADPTHVPLMVADVVHACGNLASEICDCPTREGCGTGWCPLVALHATALDAMPGGRAAVFDAVAGHLYALAAAGGWSDCLYVRGTQRHEWDGWVEPGEG